MLPLQNWKPEGSSRQVLLRGTRNITKEIKRTNSRAQSAQFARTGGQRSDGRDFTFNVKQHKNASFQAEMEFKSEVQVISKARHENLVMLLGSCSSGNHRLLVYEDVCNGSLDQHLSRKKRKYFSNWGFCRIENELISVKLKQSIPGDL
ncbi:hypothetical protein SLA2020_480650 [Shorea laevis]